MSHKITFAPSLKKLIGGAEPNNKSNNLGNAGNLENLGNLNNLGDFGNAGNSGGGGSIGGGYSDPGFHERNYIPPGQALAMANLMSGRSGADKAAAPAPPVSYGSAGTTSNTATGVRAVRPSGSGTTYSSLNRAGSTGLTIGGLNV